MDNVVEIIKKFFEKSSWKYEYSEEDRIFSTKINMENALGSVGLFILLQEDFYNVYVVLNSKIERKYYSSVAEFLHRANYGIIDGNFEMDYRDGEVRYKTFVNFKGSHVSEDIVGESIVTGLTMVNRYGKGLLKLALGDGEPEECIEYSEKNKEI